MTDEEIMRTSPPELANLPDDCFGGFSSLARDGLHFCRQSAEHEPLELDLGAGIVYVYAYEFHCLLLFIPLMSDSSMTTIGAVIRPAM